MTFQDKRDLWYVSGNKNQGDVFAVPVIELESGAEILDSEVARLKDSDVDGARRWVVVASDGERAVQKLAGYLAETDQGAVMISVHLGTGAEGRQRKAALEQLAADAGCFWGGKPSIGRWLIEIAAGRLRPPKGE